MDPQPYDPSLRHFDPPQRQPVPELPDDYDYDYPQGWKMFKDRRKEMPFIPVRHQRDSSLCWNCSFPDYLSTMRYMQEGIYEEVSAKEIRDYMTYIPSMFSIPYIPPSHDVEETIHPALDRCHTHGATMLDVLRYTRTYGIHLKGNYQGDRTPDLYRNNITPFSLGAFKKMKEVPEVSRVFIDSYRVLKNITKAKRVVRDRFPVIGAMYASFTEFESYDGTGLLPVPQDEEGRPYPADHMVIILGIGMVDGKTCFFIKNSWGPDWGWKGYAMVPVDLFTYVGFPVDIYTNSSYHVVPDDFDANWRKLLCKE